MSKERSLVLDVGIGAGGKYIKKNTAPHEIRIGIDIEKGKMVYLKRDYPDVPHGVADAKHLPFHDNSFSRIEMVLPFGDLALKGLQTDHFSMSIGSKKHNETESPRGWYEEFQRVLEPGGSIVIYGDMYVDPKQVKKTSADFFKVATQRKIDLREFKRLGTVTAKALVKEYRDRYVKEIGKKWVDLLVQINLKSKKV